MFFLKPDPPFKKVMQNQFNCSFPSAIAVSWSGAGGGRLAKKIELKAAAN
jgi:hypothetical protein